MFSSTDDAYAKIGKSVLSYKEEPYCVGAVNYARKDTHTPTYVIQLRKAELPDLSSNYDPPIPLEDKNIDWKNLGDFLGYNNQYNSAIYVSRMPVRKTIFGLRSDNIHCTSVQVPVSPNYPNGIKSVKLDHLLNKYFSDMWHGKYPSLKEIVSSFEDNHDLRSIAFHKKFAVNKKQIGPFFLEYRGRDIGWSDDINKFTLDRSFRYLTETLEYYGVDFK